MPCSAARPSTAPGTPRWPTWWRRSATSTAGTPTAQRFFTATSTSGPRLARAKSSGGTAASLAGVLGECAALVITGGHVGTLLRTLRMFALPIPDSAGHRVVGGWPWR